MEFDYSLLLVEPGGSGFRDVTQLAASITWTGAQGQTARELAVQLAVPRDGSVEPPSLEEGCALIFQAGGQTRFTGQVVQATTDSQSSVVDLSALDGGRFLAGNQGWYKFQNTTPEAAAAAICADFGITAGTLAAAGVPISRKFPGVALDQIIRTMYSMAGDANGKRYLIRFSGEGALEVVEKPEAASVEIARTMGVTNTWDIADLTNSVAIYSDTGKRIRTVADAASQALNGRLEHVITQGTGEDAGPEAQGWLEDHGLQQNLTAAALDPPLDLISGAAVLLRDTGSGASGLFWVDGDTHTFKNGQHFGKFKLNFRNIAATASAGRAL